MPPFTTVAYDWQGHECYRQGHWCRRAAEEDRRRHDDAHRARIREGGPSLPVMVPPNDPADPDPFRTNLKFLLTQPMFAPTVVLRRGRLLPRP